MATNLIRSRALFFPPKNPGDLKMIVDQLIKSPQDSVILPYIDTPGPLSDEITSRNFRSLTVCEHDPETREKFKSLVDKKCINRRIFIRSDDLIASSFKASFNNTDNNCSDIVRESLLIDGCISNHKNCDLNVNILIPLLLKKYESTFMTHLFYQFCLRIGLCQDVLVNYYILISHRHYKLLSARAGGNLNLYRRTSVLPNMIFNMHRLHTFNLKESFRIDLKKINQANYNIKASSAQQQVHLLRLEPKQDFLDSMSPKSLLELKFLVTQMMAKRKTLVFKFLDRWFDDCEPFLTTIGITEATRSGDLNNEEYLRIFRYLQSKSSYKSSTFIHAVASCEPWYQKFQDQRLRVTGTG